jgi:hypothetical protein
MGGALLIPPIAGDCPPAIVPCVPYDYRRFGFSLSKKKCDGAMAVRLEAAGLFIKK